MEIKELLKDKQIAEPIKNFADELLSVFEGKTTHDLLDKQTAEIGLILLDKHSDSTTKKDNWVVVAPVVKNDKRYEKLYELIPEEGWKNKELKSLLIYFFGEEKAGYVSHAWDQMRFQMYQTGYLRRSFRSPENRALYFINQLNFLVSAIPQIYTYGEYPDYKRTFYDLSVSEQLRFSQYLQQNQMFRVWSAALDLGNAEILKQAEDIIFNKDEIGKVTRELIKALLNSEKKEAWELIEKLLLAAQRQEGLRQTILEALDETSVGALKYMINVIISNKLARFSSVVRAVDVWAGLGWESEREKTVATFLEKAQGFLEHSQEIQAATKSANNTDVYMALWSQGVLDVERCAPFLNELYEKGNAEKRALALKFAIEAKHYKIDLPLFEKALDDSDTMVLAWALTGINNLLHSYNGEKRNFSAHPALFDKLHDIIKRVDTKEKTYDGRIFAWTRVVFNRNEALKAMIDLVGEDDARLEKVLSYFDEMSVDLREKLTRRVLPEYAIYGWQEKDKNKAKKLTKFQHDYAFRLLADKGEFVRSAGFRALDKAAFSIDEMDGLQNLLKRKGADFRGKIIQLLLKQSDEKLKDATAQLLSNGDVEQRLAGLDILLQLKKADRLEKEAQSLIENFRERKSVSQKEEILLSQLEDSDDDANKYSAENGYGFFNVEKSVSPVVEPKVDPENIYEKRTLQDSAVGKVLDKAKSWIGKSAAKHKYGFSVSPEEVKNQLQKLADLYLENKDFEYEVENWNNTKNAVLLGNTFRNKKYQFDFESPESEYREYPLPEVWEKWFQDSGLDAGDLYLIQFSKEQNCRDMIPTYKEIVPKGFAKYYYYNNPLYQIVNALQKIHPFAQKNEFMLGGCARLFASLDEKFLKAKSDEKAYSYQNLGDGWQIRTGYQTFYNAVNVLTLEENSVKDFWNLAHWRQFSGREENIPFCPPSLLTFARAFQLEIIGEDEMYRGIMRPENIGYLSAKKIKGRKDFDYYENFPFLREMFEKVREHILDIELKRGDSPTSVTRMVANLNSVYGINRFAEILIGLGKTALNRGYIYYYGNTEANKQTQFSRLLKNCYPRESNTQEEFNALMKESKISEAKLIEAAVYAPQWQKFVSNYLNWKGLDSAIWWMHAHTKIAGYREQTAESESEIAKHSAVDLQDFKDGAVDKDWFTKAYKEIGKARWEMVYNAAKYISDGNGHRRARLYADVISGKTKIKEITDRVKTKRDQDYLRMYGLVPLNKKNSEKDVLARYEYLQKFKKESRQFGSQKQTSEGLAIRIALENLARNAGYADPIRLTWAMESKQVQEIFAAETQFQKDDISVKLVVDAEGKADIVVSKGEKELKNVPPKYKKEKKIAELNEHKKTLKEQFSRSRKGLEEAMVRGDEFEFAELENLFAHPVISKHLEKLVFVSNKNHGFFKDGTLVSASGKETKLAETSKTRLAHCVDLYESKEWSDYQRYCFDNELKQPFKQIFRELYTPTEDELKEKSVSRRYAGHQIQPKQTVALLKTRGWKVDYEEGLQKVFHKEGFTAKMYALADWFSPADVEGPTLETVEFRSLKDYKNVAFKEIDARIFSEVMRDIDLVVSVAHAGGVDAEASHSSIEMRSVLLRETLRLFKIDNVEIGGNHAKIKGKMGEYSVHLGSAVVHKTGKYLSILPVQSQHRGRIFLPFADDDPKSAEVMSKVLLLARDNEIQDPTILRQLND
jgi:Family of unknown function (DUF5724)/Domain of unknown function (DUF4132)